MHPKSLHIFQNYVGIYLDILLSSKVIQLVVI